MSDSANRKEGKSGKRKKKGNKEGWTTYLAVEETVEQRDKESLEGGEKVGRIGPQGEFDD